MNDEIRSRQDIQLDGRKLVGYAAVFNSVSEDLGGFREIIRPGAFDRTLQERPDIRALAEHDTAKVLGRTKAGTLRINPDAHGLRVEIDPPDTTIARDLMESVRRGDIDGMSFRFRVPQGGDRLTFNGDVPLRELLDIDLRGEVSIVAVPAYPDTAVALRSLSAARQQHTTIELLRMRLRLASEQ